MNELKPEGLVNENPYAAFEEDSYFMFFEYSLNELELIGNSFFSEYQKFPERQLSK